MNKFVIVHFAPLELYPPIQNLLHEIEKNAGGVEVIVLTTFADRTISLPVFQVKSSKIRLVRIGASGTKSKALVRYKNYLYFYLLAILLLLRIHPSHVLYFETISSFPIYIYKRIFRKNLLVYIHYHEYTSPQECRSGMKLTNYFHRFEKWLYPRAAWVSHTNDYRMDMFKKDIFPVAIHNTFIMPNYPPRSWFSEPKPELVFPIKILYVGALSLSSMYTKEFVEWILEQRGRTHLDVYAYNISIEAKEYLLSLNSEFVKLKNGIEYSALPSILKEYDVGVILYKGISQNHIYSASNKLFEYLACGLDVWFPSEIIGSFEYITNGTYPKVIKMDFKDLGSYYLEETVDRRKNKIKYPEFYCEDALIPLLKRIHQL
jgi:hypothetical protein